jgi:hypothetical protein
MTDTMSNYFDTSTHADYLPENIRNRSELSTWKTIGQQIFLDLHKRHGFVRLRGWKDDADDVTEEGLVESVRIVIAELIIDVADSRMNQTNVTTIKQADRTVVRGVAIRKNIFAPLTRYTLQTRLWPLYAIG